MDRIEINWDLLNKYFSGGASDKEAESILSWLDENKDNKIEFIKAKKLFIETTNYYSASKENGRKAFEAFEKRIDNKASIKQKPVIKTLKPFLRYAAAILVLFGITLSAYFIGKSNKIITGKNDFYVVNVPYGGKSSVALPDGSTVYLNAGTTLKYRKGFGINSRELFLDGEGLFEVEKHKYPMIVHTSHIDIKVLGTVFNVKSYNSEDNIETTLLEGSIQVKTPGTSNDGAIYLKPNDQLIYNKSNSSIRTTKKQENEQDDKKEEQQDKIILQKQYKITSNIDVSKSVAWKEGKYIFTGETLEELAVILTRKYDVVFSFENDAVKNYTYSGTLGDYPIGQVLHALSLTSPVVYSIKEKQVLLALDEDKLKTYNKLMND